MSHELRAFVLLAAVLPLVASPPVSGRQYPARPVRLVAPFPPGSSVDFTSRLFAPGLSEALGQQFVIDNRPGAAGNIGAELVARAAPDGYTLLTAPSSLAANASLYRKRSYDLVRDFEAISLLTSAPHVLAVRPSLPAKSLKELVALAKARPGQLTYASTGVGSASHLAMELFRLTSGISYVHVPYKGSANTVPDVIGGQVDMTTSSIIALLPHVKAGRIRALGVTSLQRSPAAPDLPTFSESGYPGFESQTWAALLGPAGIPAPVIKLLNAAIARIVQTPEVAERIAAQGATPRVGPPAAARALIKADLAKWEKVIAEAGIKAE